MEASEEEIADLHGVGPVIAGEITAFFANKTNRSIVERLMESGIRYERAPGAVSKDFEGEVFAFTGALTRLSRGEAEAEVKRRGGKTTSSVSKKTTCVVVGEGPGSKLQKAQEYGTNLMDEQELLRLLESAK